MKMILTAAFVTVAVVCAAGELVLAVNVDAGL